MIPITDENNIIEQLKSAGGIVHINLSPAELIELAILNGEGNLCDNGALAADTGKFTGRSPKDRFIVEDDITREAVWWGDINLKFDSNKFDILYDKVLN